MLEEEERQGVKLVDRSEINSEVKKMFGKILVTHQTGPEGKKSKSLYTASI